MPPPFPSIRAIRFPFDPHTDRLESSLGNSVLKPCRRLGIPLTSSRRLWADTGKAGAQTISKCALDKGTLTVDVSGKNKSAVYLKYLAE